MTCNIVVASKMYDSSDPTPPHTTKVSIIITPTIIKMCSFHSQHSVSPHRIYIDHNDFSHHFTEVKYCQL